MSRVINTLINLALIADLLATRISKEQGNPALPREIVIGIVMTRTTREIVVGIVMGLVWTLCIGGVLNCGTNALLAIKLGLFTWLFMDKYMTNEPMHFSVYLSLCVSLVFISGF